MFFSLLEAMYFFGNWPRVSEKIRFSMLRVNCKIKK